jgi:DNA repair protein RadA/Sms
MGKCPGCGEWNTVVEREAEKPRSKRVFSATGGQGQSEILPITRISSDERPRIITGIGELDRVLGGGIVRRSLTLIAGDPGIGKSTLVMQALAAIAKNGETALYVSGEESAEQLKLRAIRLGAEDEKLLALTENDLDIILQLAGETEYDALALDSAQSVFTRSFDSYAGSVGQVRAVTATLMETIKKGRAACFIVGHVTKEGAIAGPRVLEHMVDATLYFEGERNHPYRILRGVKNRFGAVSEIGVFEMSEKGLIEVINPSERFLAERPKAVSGSSVTALVEGVRPILAEIQALVSGPTPGQGRRTCLGVDPQRLSLMIAVLEKRLGITLFDQDIFLNAVGGVKALEPAADLAIAASLLSSFLDRPIPDNTLIFGEVGLAGEIRRTSRSGQRFSEAARLGFDTIIAPKANVKEASKIKGSKFRAISHMDELRELIFDV